MVIFFEHVFSHFSFGRKTRWGPPVLYKRMRYETDVDYWRKAGPVCKTRRVFIKCLHLFLCRQNFFPKSVIIRLFGRYPTCKFKGCTNGQVFREGGIRGFCSSHGGAPVCKVKGCNLLVKFRAGGTKGFCSRHGGSPDEVYAERLFEGFKLFAQIIDAEESPLHKNKRRKHN